MNLCTLSLPATAGALLQQLGLVLLVLPSLQVYAQDGGFIRGRSTYYGGPDTLSTTYDAARGAGSFGILTYGSCGYTPSDGSLPFPRDEVAAAADANPDYPGSCDRCYEVKCVSGDVLGSGTSPVKIINGFYDGDKWRPYLPAINPGFKDSFGRSFPGNAGEAAGLQTVQCWDESLVVFVRVIDSCPCTQVLKAGAPGVYVDQTRKQVWCCGGQNHFDLSYWAFEKLAHPVFGVITIDYRPVDCDSRAPLQFTPGYISKYLYRDGIQTGWGWSPYLAGATDLRRAGFAPDNTAATCLTVNTGGGLSFKCRDGYKPGYQPFSGATAVDFWVTSNAAGVPLKMFLKNDEGSKYCTAEVELNTIIATETSGTWSHLNVPLSAFGCGSYPGWGQIDRLDFQNTQGGDLTFCLATVQIV